jgi:hypothetical protein
MSKVYSFRLDKNNPREAQAREVINAWVSKGYSLREIMTKALIFYRSEENHSDDFEQKLERLTQLLDALMKSELPTNIPKTNSGTLQESFVGSIAEAAKPGMKIK